jgi:hypothetical protein
VAVTVLVDGVGVTVIVFVAAGALAAAQAVASRPKEATPTTAKLTAVSRRWKALIEIIFLLYPLLMTALWARRLQEGPEACYVG